MEFALANIYRDAFGQEPPQKPEIKPAAARSETSNLGSRYYETDLFGVEHFLPVTINDVLIPYAVLGMTWKKKIVTTDMPERGGSVKEMISIDDYEFNLKGILISEDNNMPEDQIRNLFDLFQVNKSVTMRSVLSDIVLSGENQHRVVIKSIKWPPVSGIEHAKPFEMEMESDMVLELELKD